MCLSASSEATYRWCRIRSRWGSEREARGPAPYRADGCRQTFLRAELGKHLAIAPVGAEALLTLRAQNITLKLAGDGVESLRRHLGTDLETWALQMSLRETKAALWWGLGASAFWFLNGGLFSGVIAVAFLIEGIGRLVRGGRWLFLFRGLRAVAAMVAVVIDVLVLDGQWWFGFVALMLLLGATMAFRRYAFFRPLQR